VLSGEQTCEVQLSDYVVQIPSSLPEFREQTFCFIMFVFPIQQGSMLLYDLAQQVVVASAWNTVTQLVW
jgi:hypothetical protein